MSWLNLRADIVEMFDELAHAGFEGHLIEHTRARNLRELVARRYAAVASWEGHRRAYERRKEGPPTPRRRRRRLRAFAATDARRGMSRDVGACEHCGAPVYRKPPRRHPPRFCSRRCSSAETYRRHCLLAEQSPLRLIPNQGDTRLKTLYQNNENGLRLYELDDELFLAQTVPNFPVDTVRIDDADLSPLIAHLMAYRRGRTGDTRRPIDPDATVRTTVAPRQPAAPAKRPPQVDEYREQLRQRVDMFSNAESDMYDEDAARVARRELHEYERACKKES